jgi:hypothetical protein
MQLKDERRSGCFFDEDPEPKLYGSLLYLVPITLRLSVESSNRFIVGLILQSTTNNPRGQFQRVGLFTIGFQDVDAFEETAREPGCYPHTLMFTTVCYDAEGKQEKVIEII